MSVPLVWPLVFQYCVTKEADLTDRLTYLSCLLLAHPNPEDADIGPRECRLIVTSSNTNLDQIWTPLNTNIKLLTDRLHGPAPKLHLQTFSRAGSGYF